MATPSISGVTLLRTTTVNTGLSIVGTGASYSGVTTNALYLRFTGVAYNANTENYIQIDLDSTQNLAGRGFFFGSSQNLNMAGASTNRIAFVSAAGVRFWDIRHGANTVVEFYLDAEGNSFTDADTFDITAVTSMRFYWNSTGASSNRSIDIYRPYSFLKSNGVVIQDGDNTTSVTPSSIATLMRSLLLGGSAQAVNIVGTNYFEFPIPLTLSPTTSSFLSGALVFSAVNYPAAFNSNVPRTALTTRILNVNTSVANTFSGFQINGVAGQEFAFNELSSATNTYNEDCLILRHNAVDLGDANWLGTLSGGIGAITGGAIHSGTIRNNAASYAIEWNGTTQYQNLSLTQTSNAHYINCDGANFTDGATLDVSTIAFGTPGTRKVRVDASGKTLNIQTAGGFTLSDVTVVAGTVNIVAPESEIVLSNIPDVEGAFVGVRDLTSLDETFPTITGTTCTIPTNPSRNYLIAVDAPGWIAQQITLSGAVPSFTLDWNNRDYRALYELGDEDYEGITLDYDTFVALVDDSLEDIDKATAFRRIEDLLANPLAIFFDRPPFPQIIDLGDGNDRTYFVFPAVSSGVPNPVTILPDEDNTLDPRFTDFVVIFPEAADPFYSNISTASNGRRIRIQTEAVGVALAVSGGLSTEDRAVIDAVKAKTDQLAFSVANQVDANALSGGGGSVDAQDIADALKLAPAAGTPAAGSVYSQLGSIKTDTGTTLPELIGDLPEPLDANATEAAAAAALAAYDPPTRAELTSDLDEIKGVGFDPERDTLRRIYRDTLKRPFVGGDE